MREFHFVLSEIGFKGLVYMCVFVICCRICLSVWGVWTNVLSVAWLCTQLMDMSAGSIYW